MRGRSIIASVVATLAAVGVAAADGPLAGSIVDLTHPFDEHLQASNVTKAA